MGASRECASGCKPSEGNFCGIGVNCPPMPEETLKYFDGIVDHLRAWNEGPSLYYNGIVHDSLIAADVRAWATSDMELTKKVFDNRSLVEARQAERERAMSYRTKAETYRKRAEELELKALEVEAFGSDDEYPTDSVIFFKRTFHYDTSHWKKFDGYTYVAVKVSNGYWYITGKGSRPYAWEELVEEHLIKAKKETDEVWLARKWEQL